MKNKKLYLLTFTWENCDIMGRIIIKNNDDKSIISSVNKIMGKEYYYYNTRDGIFYVNNGRYFDLVEWQWVYYKIETIDVL